MKAVSLENVSFVYEGSDEYALKDVNFFINYGEVTVLTGMSGSGKSTVISLICGIIPEITPGTLSGTVVVDGESTAGKKTGDICRKVAVVLQNADAQIIQNTVEDEIAFGCENFGFDRERISREATRACSFMKLDKNWQTATLSGGQKQRLMTACALATGQRILVLDEPLANLDAEGAKRLMLVLRQLARQGYAVLIAEHRLDFILSFADVLWRADKGRVFIENDKQNYLSGSTEIIEDNCNAVPSDDIAFELADLGYKAGNRQILKGVNLRISKGERLVILGENGCGKTTLLRLISRLVKPNDGQIWQNVVVTKKKNADKKWFRKVGVVYQNPNYQLFMPTVKKEIEFGSVDKDYAKQMICAFGLGQLEGRHPQSLSEGQKRKVSIAAVLASKPDVLILDEPTVGQDYEGLENIVRILNEIHEKTGNTMITVTHDVRCADALCDRAAVIKDGKVSESGGKELVKKYFAQIN